MATPAQFKVMNHAVPFRPYRVNMVSGDEFIVNHPENASWDERGPNLVIHMGGEIYQVEMRLVETLQPLTPTKQEN